MALQTVLITGCDQGIGFVLAEQYAANEWSVIATMKDKRNAKQFDRLKSVRVVEMDVADQNSVTNAAVHLSGEKTDVLINNTDVLIRGGLEDVSDHDFLTQLQVNTLGPFLITRAFLPNLRIAVNQMGFAKVVNMGSRMGSIADNVSGGLYGYRASKAGLHMVSKSLAIDLKHENITVLLVHVGHVTTETATATVESSPSAIAEKMVKLIDHAGIQDTGTFLNVDGREVPW